MIKTLKIFLSTSAIKGILAFLIFSLFISPSSAQNRSQDALVSTVSRTKISIDETIELQVRYYGPSKRGKPDFTQLSTSFEVISTRQSNQFSSVNGQVTSYTDWVLVLEPKKEGRLLIPSFRFGSLISDAVQVTVSPQKKVSGKVKDIFLETFIEKDSVYVQEQIIVKYRLFYSRNVSSLNNEDLNISNAVQEVLPDIRYNRRINGKLYAIAEFAYAVFPQESGELVIPQLVWDVNVPKTVRSNSFFGMTGRTETLRLRTEQKKIQVLPRPDSFPNTAAWVPASNVTLEETWSRDPKNLNIGEPITRTITLKTEGLMAAQLPPVWSNANTSDVKVYADQAELKDEPSADGFNSLRIESSAIVLNKNGSTKLPAVKIPWWNTRTNALEYAALPEVTLSAAGSKPATNDKNFSATTLGETTREFTNTPAISQQNQQAIGELKNQLASTNKHLRTWQLISLGLFVIVITLIACLWLTPTSRSKNGSTEHSQDLREKSAKQAFSALLKACQSGSNIQIRQALITWAQIKWQKPSIQSLDQVIHELNDQALTEQIKKIDAALYSGKEIQQIDALQIASMLKNLDTLKKSNKNSKSAIAALYPSAT
ncbi:MAG: BatD family protein [Agarilytica sp.]